MGMIRSVKQASLKAWRSSMLVASIKATAMVNHLRVSIVLVVSLGCIINIETYRLHTTSVNIIL